MTGSTFWTEMLGGSISYYDSNGVRTRVLEAGSGEPVILLHGLTGHAETWIRNVVPLSERFRVLAIDMVGHGLTDKPDGSYHIPTFVGHLRDFMHAAEIDQAHLVGQALGAWVATSYALEHAEDVRSLSLATLVGLKLESPQNASTKTPAPAHRVDAPTRESIREQLQRLMYKANTVPDELVQVRYHFYTRDDFQRVASKIVEQITGEASAPYMLTPDRLRQISVPTLVLWTPHGQVQLEEAKTVADLIPDSEFAVLEDCAAWPQFEDATGFNKVLATFVEKASQS